ncbi:hypothetical protein HPP92_020075 [Vanilla planifolia]|uniref:Uncharacterized protein n=1 Tax=Vanilla planifolia TaxID=51239 RepID=A0A835ULQ4_VANPL|nr:hypothetical protein HPP92_020075 [Vanilla planifolia]
MEMECCFHPEEPKSPTLPSLRQKIRSTISSCFRCVDPEDDRSAASCIGRPSRRGLGEFRYDPLSYALNFDEGGEGEDGHAEEFPYRNFSSRLPATPPHHAFV